MNRVADTLLLAAVGNYQISKELLMLASHTSGTVNVRLPAA
jgi:hypothetical protein